MATKRFPSLIPNVKPAPTQAKIISLTKRLPGYMTSEECDRIGAWLIMPLNLGIMSGEKFYGMVA